MKEPYIVKSPLTMSLLSKVNQLSLYPTTVLIEGEVGSGKEWIAKTIHQLSKWSNMPFIKVSCGSIVDQTEIFEIDRSASATAARTLGLFETVNEGTLFLDEVGELGPTLQVKLLRFLQDHENEQAGGSWSKKVNIRIIASSTIPLNQLVKDNKFRGDLYYRLNVANLEVPPLRNRPEEILPLLNHYLDYFCMEYNIKKWFTNETLEILGNYSYPGNVLELRNLVEKLCVTSNSDAIMTEDLPQYIHPRQVVFGSLEAQVGEFESRLIGQALEMEGSIRKAAVRLQISHATLLRKMQKWGIEK